MSQAVVTGAWRDRTNLYISYRQSYAHHPAKRTRIAGPHYTDDDAERAGLMSSLDNDNADAIIEMDVLPPRWLDIQDDVQRHLTDIAPKMKRLEQLHNKHVLPGFDDESVKAAEEREIEAMTQDITRDFSACQRAIKRIDIMVRDQQQASGQISSADETMAKNLKRSLAARVGDVSTLFRKKQSAYMKKLRTLGGMPGLSSPSDRSGTPLAQNTYNVAMMESETDRSTAQSTLLQTAQVRRRDGAVDRTIQQREAEIEKIAQGVIDLSNLFQDLQTMVIDQGTVLDRIDYNVERTAEHVQAADKELKVATGYQKRSMRRKIIFLLILIVFGMLVLLLIKPKRGSSSAPPHKSAPLPNVPLQGSEGGSDFFPPRRLVRRDLLYYDPSPS
ncbi:t-SNARE [Dissoconium aciculare CBS 342.82]|uniref:t-SNARE n=1 Tax=Dissoconium aciculare CBS 342.82 TaxID=1314786 RepID=A0A6J3M5T5_9PEZI|nr:t-SNARE [Dissoconium aciculare CBS 342.82]KAF1822207.1 t-SNARE [Dissoconium aciculare CBS 342.82]